MVIAAIELRIITHHTQLEKGRICSPSVYGNPTTKPPSGSQSVSPILGTRLTTHPRSMPNGPDAIGRASVPCSYTTATGWSERRVSRAVLSISLPQQSTHPPHSLPPPLPPSESSPPAYAYAYARGPTAASPPPASPPHTTRKLGPPAGKGSRVGSTVPIRDAGDGFDRSGTGREKTHAGFRFSACVCGNGPKTMALSGLPGCG